MAKQNKPAIRFKGFTDAWEQRKLGEILQERNTRTSDFESNPLYSLTIESGVTPKTDRYERSSLVTKTEDLFKTVKPNEFVTNPMNLRFGALGYNKNAFTVSVSGYYDVFSIDDDKCSGFWNAYFKTPTAMNIFDNAATGSLIEKRRVKYSTLQQLAFYMPNDLSEKAEIGKYMDTFDHLITLHQRKYDKLQVLKKAMLEKMFPKNGSSVPEIRFKGFTDAWEQRKLGDIADIVGGGTPSTGNPSYWDGEIDWYAPAEIADQIYANSSQKKITDLGYENSSAKMLPPGTVLFTSRAGIGKTAILTQKGCTNQGFQSIVPHREELDSYFVFSRTEELKRYGELVGAGSTFVEVSGKQMAAMELMMPSTMREQQTIGGFFRHLDNLITLHQRELEKLQNIKKSMLEKMFV
ncbi:MAG: restriction endonuclease subunit S [Gemmiger sp.]|uniref:restriction endonuclease subunit S n=1 Tax=Gemmiger sp. TaxID=2049027 RepID=UPI002A821902|nr:restriction endonuclease subunit S [Gemmiger sp.]MDY4773703.1 restriction endonuclease subunit S [Gemmiger sp.]